MTRQPASVPEKCDILGWAIWTIGMTIIVPAFYATVTILRALRRLLGIHQCRSIVVFIMGDWYTECEVCGRRRRLRADDLNTVPREMFADAPDRTPEVFKER